MPKQKQKNPDVAIAGGGFVGLTLALALAGPESEPSGLKVTILNAAAAKGQGRPDQRASAITAASRRMLMRLGAWNGLDELAQPVSDMVITDSRLDQAARLPFLVFKTGDGAEDGMPAAWIVENAHLAERLRGAVAGNRSIQVRQGARVNGFASDGAGVTVETADGGP
ncbi:MAG TPA: FAD-dependent monooxygenase, partial [Hyphomicrobiales bacterium]|nr:FAD-dependent monooxygenase [Hyphomicrobiales bacterium]